MRGGAGGDSGRLSNVDLVAQVSNLEEEVAVLRRRLADSPRQVRALEERLAEVQASLAGAVGQNDRLVGTLREARDQIITLKGEVDRLAQPPASFGVFIAPAEDRTADIFTSGRKMRVSVSPDVDLDALTPGREVMVNEAMNVVKALEFDEVGEVLCRFRAAAVPGGVGGVG